MIVDSHAHLNFSDFDQDREAVYQRCRDQNMIVVNVGTNAQTSKEVVTLAHSEPSFFASVGIHPAEISELLGKNDILVDAFEHITALAQKEKVVAVGEVGLDYYRLINDVEAHQQLQKEYFIKHIELAVSRQLPLIIHGRGQQARPYAVYDDILDCLAPYTDIAGAAHCFGGDVELAQKYAERGFFIGVTGIITFKNNVDVLREVVRVIPLEKILIETDCPYLAPEPYRGKRNESSYVHYVAEKIAELKNINTATVVEQTTYNAQQLFKFL
jgi:TatD DNase family protein